MNLLALVDVAMFFVGVCQCTIRNKIIMHPQSMMRSSAERLVWGNSSSARYALR